MLKGGLFIKAISSNSIRYKINEISTKYSKSTKKYNDLKTKNDCLEKCLHRNLIHLFLSAIFSILWIYITIKTFYLGFITIGLSFLSFVLMILFLVVFLRHLSYKASFSKNEKSMRELLLANDAELKLSIFNYFDKIPYKVSAITNIKIEFNIFSCHIQNLNIDISVDLSSIEFKYCNCKEIDQIMLEYKYLDEEFVEQKFGYRLSPGLLPIGIRVVYPSKYKISELSL